MDASGPDTHNPSESVARVASTALSPRQTSREQRALVREGCLSLLGFVAVLLCLLLLDQGTAEGLRRLSLPKGSTDTVVVANFRSIANEMIGAPPFALALVVTALVAFKSRAAAGLASAVVIASAVALGMSEWYRPFVAIQFGPGWVEVRYLWPRPAERLDLRRLQLVDSEYTSERTSGPHNVRLVLTMCDGRRLYSGGVGSVAQVSDRLREQAGLARSGAPRPCPSE